ncbi:uncharacterized protein LOC105425568 [Pogonomyrmex barbatus]|uniref:Uncharacterized protein LOC105425568 n=1 Tax=Pogonomyrmex barbatus TaxID=144034 RepID=A0A8N1S4D7_9HYME|nr:uncharacterized protein LOC105425568 [Pogonomyrmex barbatus]
MDLAVTQIYEDEDFPPTQDVLRTVQEEESDQIGTLSINSTEYQIKKGITKIGRNINCDIVINDGVSFILFLICTRI